MHYLKKPPNNWRKLQINLSVYYIITSVYKNVSIYYIKEFLSLHMYIFYTIISSLYPNIRIYSRIKVTNATYIDYN